jgi:tryptophanyl-tRNA synthetase
LAERGCVDCKKELSNGVNQFFSPIRDRRAEYAAKPKLVDEILSDGARRARIIANETIVEVREKMGLSVL